MKFRIKDLEEFLFAKKINWLKIVNELNKKSFESNLINDYLEVEILPNRFADAGNIRGLAKEISVINDDVKFKDVKFKLKEENISYPIQVKIETKRCYYYLSRIILNIKNKPSPIWLKNFLKFYNINSINFLVDLSNFVMIKFGAPIHIFDLDKIKNKTIIVRQANNNEKFLSLKNKLFSLTNEDLVIADKEKILALAGIQGSKFAAVDLNTKNIFIEAAIFDNFSIYKTSRKLNLITEASYRFERKIVPTNSQLALDYLCYLIQKESSGKVIKNRYYFQKHNIKQIPIFLQINKLLNYTGIDIKFSDIIKILNKIGCKIIKKNNQQLIIYPPQDRLDLISDVDIIEEIIRIIGYEKLSYIYPKQFNYPKENNYLNFKDNLRNFLIQTGFTEVITYSFIDDNDLNNLKELNDFQPIEIINPNSNLYKYYRPFIFPNLIKAVSKNLSLYNWLEIKKFNLFEIGNVGYYKNNKINEFTNLSIIVSSEDLNKDFLKLKGLLTKLFEILGIINISFKTKSKNNFHLVSEIIINQKISGLFLIPEKEKLNLKQGVVISEIYLNQLIDYRKKEKRFIYPPKFPAIFRDLSFVVPIYFQKDELEKEIINKLKDILEKIELIDVYYLNDKEKSLTFHLIFRSKNRTLKDNEVNELIEELIKYLKDKFNIIIR